jgi:hypothetical protein
VQTTCRLVLQIAIPDGEAMKIPKFFRFLRTFAAGLVKKIRQTILQGNEEDKN